MPLRTLLAVLLLFGAAACSATGGLRAEQRAAADASGAGGTAVTTPRWTFAMVTHAGMRETAREEPARMGIEPAGVDQPIGTLSGGQRQCVAIARAVHFGARVLVLDEPTAALGVKQSGVVLTYVVAARDAGLGVVLITHNPHHAYLVGNRFLLLKRGRMAGGEELAELRHELDRPATRGNNDGTGTTGMDVS
ncbi:ABC-type sugar transport system ATPase subunit [Streptacidiphilus sp. MAP12-20]